MFKNQPQKEMLSVTHHEKVFIENGKKFLLWGSEYFVLPTDIRELTVEGFINLGCFTLSIRAKNALRSLFYYKIMDGNAFIYDIFDKTAAELEREPNCGKKTCNEIYEAVKLLAEIYGWQYAYKRPFLQRNGVEPYRKTPADLVIKRAIKTLEKYGYTVVAPNGKAA